jgi:hypothetical protein
MASQKSLIQPPSHRYRLMCDTAPGDSLLTAGRKWEMPAQLKIREQSTWQSKAALSQARCLRRFSEQVRLGLEWPDYE